MLTLGTIILEAHAVLPLASFWCEALELHIVGPSNEETSVTLANSDERAIFSIRHPRREADDCARPRFALYARDTQDVTAEVERLVAVGASPVDDDPYPNPSDIALLDDPGGNRFAILSNIDQSRGSQIDLLRG
ncbi:MAG: hypothetical protein L0H59_00245 [Tomitella sp.]|nr:hypothetical protein [Tomitella sp.]